MTNLYDAHIQWVTRPADERFASLESLQAHVTNRRNGSSEERRSLKHIDVKLAPDGNLGVNGESPLAYFSNWSFGQLARAVGAPASYLRSLSPEMARDCLRYGLNQTDGDSKLLIRESLDGFGQPQAAAFTGATYGRIWDADVLTNLIEAVMGSGWHVPPARDNNESENAGIYASDRDMFAFLINDEHPIEIGNAKLGRGFFCWNSETGAGTFGLTTFLYNHMCDNQLVYGAQQVKDLRIIGRNTQGLRLMKLDENDTVVAAAKIVQEENGEDESSSDNP